MRDSLARQRAIPEILDAKGSRFGAAGLGVDGVRVGFSRAQFP